MKRTMPTAMRKLLTKIKITSMLIGREVDIITVGDIVFNNKWTELPAVMRADENPEAKAGFILIYQDEKRLVFSEIYEEGVMGRKTLFVDAEECIQVQIGKMEECVTGTIIEPGKDFFLPFGQPHQYRALETTIFTATLKLF